MIAVSYVLLCQCHAYLMGKCGASYTQIFIDMIDIHYYESIQYLIVFIVLWVIWWCDSNYHYFLLQISKTQFRWSVFYWSYSAWKVISSSKYRPSTGTGSSWCVDLTREEWHLMWWWCREESGSMCLMLHQPTLSVRNINIILHNQYQHLNWFVLPKTDGQLLDQQCFHSEILI